jgi:hypothetical protein
MGASGAVRPRDWFAPADHGLAGWTYDCAQPTAGTAPTAGVLQLARVHLPASQIVTGVALFIVNAGVGLTSGQNFAGLYSSAGTRLDVTADQSGTWNAGGLKLMALAGGALLRAQADYYVAWWTNAATTIPTFARTGNGIAIGNANLAAPNLRFATADTGLTTSAPASLGAQTAAGIGWWAALY